jgi:DNA-binding NtrC family response regulator
MKILIIDDDDQMRRMIERILRLAGHYPLLAADGARGMDIFRKEQPEIVITDIIMPEQEGLGTIMMMRRECPGAKVIAMSGGGQVGDLDVLDAANKLGADEILSKPFESTDLLELIDRLTSKDVRHADPGEALRRLVTMSRQTRLGERH